MKGLKIKVLNIPTMASKQDVISRVLYCLLFMSLSPSIISPALAINAVDDLGDSKKSGGTLNSTVRNAASLQVSVFDAYQYALHNNANLGIERSRINADSAANQSVKSLILPQVNLNIGLYANQYKSNDPVLNYQGDAFDDVSSCQSAPNATDCLLNILDGVNYSKQDNNFNSQELRLSVVQPIYDAQRFRAIEGAEENQKNLELRQFKAEQELVLSSAQKFVSVLLASDKKSLTESQWQEKNQQLSRQKKLLDSGLMSEEQYFDSQLEFSQIKLALLSVESSYESSLSAWRQLSGNSVQNANQKTSEALSGLAIRQDIIHRLLPSEKLLDDWQQMARNNNVNVRQLLALKEQAVQSWRQAKAGHYPTVNLAAYYSNRNLVGGEGFIPGSEEAAIGIDIHMPLYQGGRTSNKISQMAFNKIAAEEEFNLFLVNLDRQVQQQYRLILQYQQQLQLLQTMVSNSNKSKQLVQAKINTGELLFTYQFPVNKRYGDLLLEQRRVQYQLILSALEFKLLVGNLKPSDLSIIDKAIYLGSLSQSLVQ